jgi:transposase
MRTEYFITMDAHSRTSDVCVKTRLGKLVRREHLPTTIPHLVEFIEAVPRPRRLSFEESSIAGWLYRNLHEHADETIVCDPRRNGYVAKDGDKDDPIDAEKLNDLYRGGFLRAVHQQDTAEKAALKQMIGMYHHRVGHRVGEANSLLALGKRWGLLLRSAELVAPEAGKLLVDRFANVGAAPEVLGLVQDMHEGYVLLLAHEDRLYKQVCRVAASNKVMQRVAELPGYGPIRSATLICYLDTPWRFKSKSALWKYVGIGLKREKSGDAPAIIKVEQECNRLLRNVVIGAAKSAIEQKDNVFARRYANWLSSGLSPRNARRNVARDQVTAIWGMWKTDKAFDPKRIADRETE